MRPLLLCCLPLLLTQCVDPYGNPMSPFGQPAPRPYSEGRETYRSDMREQDRSLSRQAYERGMREGGDDARYGNPRNTQRNPFGYSSAQADAYADGYEQGYRASDRGQGGNYAPPAYGSNAPGYPSNQGQGQGYTPPAPTAPATNDPGYNQGYEYGLRDRVAGKQADAGAHVGRYDPRQRRSFERGYYDAFETRR